MTEAPFAAGAFFLPRALQWNVMDLLHDHDHAQDTDPREVTLNVEGMTCASCVAHVQKAVKSVPGVKDAQVNLARGRATVRFDPTQTNPQKLADAVEHSGYHA